MSKLRRFHKKGDSYFITTVTFERNPVLVESADLLMHAFREIGSRTPYELIAWVILPQHSHIILNPIDADISKLIQRIKMSFAASYRKKQSMKSGRVWQHRFWDHIIRNDEDMNRHVDYIHYSPVKHGLVKSASQWQHSSLQDYIRRGFYSADWGGNRSYTIEGDFGE